MLSAPRTNPGGRNSRTGLPPWVVDGKTILRPGMSDTNGGQKSRHELRDTKPRRSVPLTTSPKRSSPQGTDVVPKCTQALGIGRNRVIRKIATHHLSQPSALLRDRFMHSSPQSFFDGPQPGPHPISTRFAFEKEVTSTRVPTNVGKSQKVERFRFAKTASFSGFGSIATKLNQTCLVRMQR